MLVVKIELWPRGLEKDKEEIGRTYIFNDGSGSTEHGNYQVRVCRKGSYEADADKIVDGSGCTRVGSVERFPRLAYNVWRLVLRSLRSAFPEEK